MELQELWSELEPLLNSNWFSTLVAGAAGAFFGAVGSQYAINRLQSRQAAVADLLAIRAAISLTFYITNRFMTLKLQHVRGMKQEYDSEQVRFKKFVQAFQQAQAARRPTSGPFVFNANLEGYSPISVPMERLERTVFEDLILPTRTQVIAIELGNSINTLADAIEYRSQLIDEFRKNMTMTRTELAELYFGLNVGRPGQDARFRSNVTALSDYTDDCIFFGKMLGDELQIHGTNVRKRHVRRFGSQLPKVDKLDWSKAESNELVPPLERYTEWLSGFARTPRPRERMSRWINSRHDQILAWALGGSARVLAWARNWRERTSVWVTSRRQSVLSWTIRQRKRIRR